MTQRLHLTPKVDNIIFFPMYMIEKELKSTWNFLNHRGSENSAVGCILLCAQVEFHKYKYRFREG